MGRIILVRLDDISPTMDYRQFDKAVGLMEQYGIKALLGVVPDNKDKALDVAPAQSDFWALVRQLQEKGFSIAMHGVNHTLSSKARGRIDSRMESEFAGVPFEDQEANIRKGKEMLERHGIRTDAFFAPAHSYDDDTLKALYHCGFRYMSDGKSRKPYCRFGIKCLPCRSGGIPAMRFGRIHTAVIHTNEWSRPGNEHLAEEFERLLREHHNEIVCWEQFKDIPSGARIIQMIDERMYVAYQRYLYPILLKLLKRVRHR